MFGRGLVDPFLGEQLLSVPHALLEVELPGLGQVVRAEVKTPASGGVTLRGMVPVPVFDSQRLEQLAVQVAVHRLADGTAHNDGYQVGVHAVVGEFASRLAAHGDGQGLLRPVSLKRGNRIHE